MADATPRLDYGLFDADNHYYEPRDCFTRYIEPEFRDRAVVAVTDDDGRERVMVGSTPFTFLEAPFRDQWARPGSLREMLKAMSSGSFVESEVVVPVDPAYVNRDARLALMDAQGVEAALIFPTLAVCVEHFMKDDPDQLYANFHAFNRWLDEDWGFAHRDRIFATPLLSLRDVDRAVAELEWVLDRGARCVALRPGPAFGRSPADPHFDPFWARVNEAGVLVAFHIGESGYNEMMGPFWGEEANPSSHKQSAFQWCNSYGDRPIMDTFSALVLHNLFGRFPNVRCLSVENGSLFVPYLLKQMNKMNGMGRNGPWLGGRITEKPSEIFKRHVWVSPFHEEDVPALATVIGADRVLFGSDFPHAEGLAEPRDFVESLSGMSDADVRRIMRDNLHDLLGGVRASVPT
ncbi:MAG: amidohydrolase [Actinobacteria bacterium]|nr:amidohydrolase [Actinomycetota bacterium]